MWFFLNLQKHLIKCPERGCLRNYMPMDWEGEHWTGSGIGSLDESKELCWIENSHHRQMFFLVYHKGPAPFCSWISYHWPGWSRPANWHPTQISDDTKLGQTVGTPERDRLQLALDNLLDGHRGGAWNSISKSVKLCTWRSTIQATPTLWGIISWQWRKTKTSMCFKEPEAF